jgi:hypothetical protein
VPIETAAPVVATNPTPRPALLQATPEASVFRITQVNSEEPS